MNKIQAGRMLKLAAFLDELPKEKFKFTVFMVEDGKPPLEALAAGAHACGTVGCAVGWMPARFPRSFRWGMRGSFNGARGIFNIKTGEHGTAGVSGFFGITLNEANSLFIPSYGEGTPDGDATARQVATHLRRFVRKKGFATGLRPTHLRRTPLCG